MTDREDVREVLLRYADLIDAARFTDLQDLFTDDAEAVLLGHRVSGNAQIVDHMSRSLARYQVTSHHISNQVVVLESDHARQTGESHEVV